MNNVKELGMIVAGNSTLIYFKKYFAEERFIKYDKQEITNALLDTASDLTRFGEIKISDIQLDTEDNQIYLDINKPIQEVVTSFCKISALNDNVTYHISFAL